jgi:HSP20 family protein
MAELTTWRRREIARMRDELETLFRRLRREFGVSQSMLPAAELSAIEFSESEDTLTIRTMMADFDPKQIYISVTEETLTIQGGAVSSSTGDQEYRLATAHRTRTFLKSVSLPCRIRPEAVRATFKDGILTVQLPKCKPPSPHRVTIEVN